MDNDEFNRKMNALIDEPAQNKAKGIKRVHIWVCMKTYVNIEKFFKSKEFQCLTLKKLRRRYAIVYGPLGQFADILEGQKGYVFITLIKGD